jgi:hypothetical protein
MNSSATPPRRARSARQFPWTKEEDALLGKLFDREVAEKLNRTLSGVRGRRKFLGIAAVAHAPQTFRMKPEPRDRYAHLFSGKSDRELRAILGWSYNRIRTRRRQLAAGKSKQREDWTLEEDRLLGTRPDRVLAKMFGRSLKSIRARRGLKRIRVKKDWRPEDDKVLGTRPDRAIAMLLGRSQTNVAWRRKKLGIPPKAGRRPWTPEEEALLGARSDTQLASLFDRTVKAVEARRCQLGRSKHGAVFRIVRPAGPGARYCTWTPEEDGLLGKFTDEEVARKLGYPLMRVRRRRRLLGLPSCNPNHRHWTKEEMALLGTRPDRDVAELVKRSVGNVRYKRLELGIPFANPHYEVWKADELALLGKLPDEDVVKRTGHSLTSVRHARTKRRIFSVKRAVPEWRPEEEAMLGTAPDEVIAARLNRTLGAVRFRRGNKGIPPCRPGTLARSAE